MKERPIPFSAPMVRAILDGRKSQTRRIVKPQPWAEAISGHFVERYIAGNGAEHAACALFSARPSCGPPWASPKPVRCRYGQPGDRLWVRETFAKIDGQTQPWIETDYRATYKHGDRLGDSLGIKKRWTPSIHMPRAASRITLEVTGVRVERLQDISPNDCIAEGAWPVAQRTLGRGHEAVAAYQQLWEQINGPGSWAANPWVWVVLFKRIPQEESAG